MLSITSYVYVVYRMYFKSVISLSNSFCFQKKDDGSREQLGTLKILCKYPRLLGRIAVMAYMW